MTKSVTGASASSLGSTTQTISGGASTSIAAFSQGLHAATATGRSTSSQWPNLQKLHGHSKSSAPLTPNKIQPFARAQKQVTLEQAQQWQSFLLGLARQAGKRKSAQISLQFPHPEMTPILLYMSEVWYYQAHHDLPRKRVYTASRLRRFARSVMRTHTERSVAAVLALAGNNSDVGSDF